MRKEDDLLALSILFEDYLLSSGDIGLKIYDQFQQKQHTKSPKLKEYIDGLTNCQNPNWNNIQIVGNEENINIDSLVNDLNSGCWWIVKEQLSQKDEVQVDWSTKKSGKFYVQEKDNKEGCGVLFCPYINDEDDEKILQKGQRAEFNFEEEYYSIPDILSRGSVNRLAQLNKKKKDSLILWKVPEYAIPSSGELVEDVQQLTSQYKKQIEACETFSNGDIVNPVLAGSLLLLKKCHRQDVLKLVMKSLKKK